MQTININQQVRISNSRIVFEAIQDNQPLFRTDIAQMMDMSLPSVTRVVSRLMEMNLIEETDNSVSSGRGRKALGLQVKDSGIYTVGLCASRNNIDACLIDGSEKILSQTQVMMKDEYSLEDLTQITKRLIKTLQKDANIEITSIKALGLSIPGVVSNNDGIVHLSDVLAWTETQVTKPLCNALGIDVVIENDVNACLLSERVKRGLTKQQDAVYLMIDQGMGMAMCANGYLVRGQDNRAGELDRIPVEAGTALQEHLLEKYLIARAKKADCSVTSLEDLKKAYEMKLHWAVWLIEGLRSHLLTVLGMIQGLCAPHSLILGGSVIECFNDLLKSDLPDNAILSQDFSKSSAFGAAIYARKAALEKMFCQDIKE